MFNVGDKVVHKAYVSGYTREFFLEATGTQAGDVLTVKEITCGGECVSLYGNDGSWSVSRFELVQPEPVFKVGDRVIVTDDPSDPGTVTAVQDGKCAVDWDCGCKNGLIWRFDELETVNPVLFVDPYGTVTDSLPDEAMPEFGSEFYPEESTMLTRYFSDSDFDGLDEDEAEPIDDYIARMNLSYEYVDGTIINTTDIFLEQSEAESLDEVLNAMRVLLQRAGFTYVEGLQAISSNGCVIVRV